MYVPVKSLTAKDWSGHYSKIQGYTFLSKDENGVLIGFASYAVKEGVVEITEPEELRKVQMHRESANFHPQPMELKKA